VSTISVPLNAELHRDLRDLCEARGDFETHADAVERLLAVIVAG
jgi:hypothetical protein